MIRIWAILLVLFALTAAARAQTLSDAQLIEAIESGHAKLRANVQNASGVLNKFKVLGEVDYNQPDKGVDLADATTQQAAVNLEGLEMQSNFHFVRSADSLWLEVANTSKEAWIPFRGSGNTDPTVFVRGPNLLFHFAPLSGYSTGKQTVYIHEDPNYLRKELRPIVGAIDSLTCIGGAPVNEMIRQDGARFEQATVNGQRIIRIKRSQPIAESRRAGFEIVLDSQKDYALCSYRLDSKLQGATLSSFGFVEALRLPGGELVPRALGEYKIKNLHRRPSKGYSHTVAQLQFESLRRPNPVIFTLDGVATIANRNEVTVPTNGMANPVEESIWQRFSSSFVTNLKNDTRGSLRVTRSGVVLLFAALLLTIGVLIWLRIRVRRDSANSSQLARGPWEE